MIWMVLFAAAAIAVAIVGVRQTVFRLATLLLGAATGIASLWLLGLFFYLAAIALAVAAFGLLVALFVALLKPSEQ